MPALSRTYLDYNASAPLLDAAREAMLDTLSRCGNASSVHFEGREARKTIEDSRSTLAELIGADPSGVIFTSGATEAANHALAPHIRKNGKEIKLSALYHSAIEHPCVLSGGWFSADKRHSIPVTEGGVVDVPLLESLLSRHDSETGAPLVAVMLANNETGIIQPVAEIAELVHSHDGYLVVDAVQALGKVPVSIAALDADFLIFSSHKIGGPQGCGALVMADKTLSPSPLISGGGQENFHRAGTENTAAIAGFGAACRWHLENLTKNVNISTLRDSIEDRISTISLESGNGVSQPVFFGKSQKRLANTSCFAVAGIKAETALVALDLAGISVSSGSACSSGKVKRSHVLEAMNVGEAEMEGALRLSLGWEEDETGAEQFLSTWKEIVARVA